MPLVVRAMPPVCSVPKFGVGGERRGRRTASPCTVVAWITKTARPAGPEPYPKWRSRLSHGKFSFLTVGLGKTPGLGRWHAGRPGKTSPFDSINFFVFSQKKHLTFSVLFSIVFLNTICGKILGCGSSRTAAIFRPQNGSRQSAGSDPLAARSRQTAEDCGGWGVFFVNLCLRQELTNA